MTEDLVGAIEVYRAAHGAWGSSLGTDKEDEAGSALEAASEALYGLLAEATSFQHPDAFPGRSVAVAHGGMLYACGHDSDGRPAIVVIARIIEADPEGRTVIIPAARAFEAAEGRMAAS
jgi:hypothetical protein